MKISREELKEMIRESVKTKLRSKLNESFSAKRTIIDLAQNLSRQFETDICKNLGIKDPDQMDPDTQKAYLAVVEKMKEEFVRAAMEATRELIKFPKNEPSE